MIVANLRLLVLGVFIVHVPFLAVASEVIELKKIPDAVEVDIGFRDAGEVEEKLRLVNRTPNRLVISSIRPTCSCVIVGDYEKELLPGAEMEFKFRLSKSNFSGVKVQPINIYFFGEVDPFTIAVSASVRADVALSSNRISFDEKTPKVAMDLVFDASSVQIQSVGSLTPGINVSIAKKDQGRWSLEVSSASDSVVQRTELVQVEYTKGGTCEKREFPVEVFVRKEYFFFPKTVSVDVVDGEFTTTLRVASRKSPKHLVASNFSVDFGGKAGVLSDIQVKSLQGKLALLELTCSGLRGDKMDMVLNLSEDGVVVASVPIRIVSIR